MIKSTEHSSIELIQILETFSEKQLTGELIVHNQQFTGRLFLRAGNLLYIKDDFYQVRRWQRALQQYSPKYNLKIENMQVHSPWECQMIHQGINQQGLSYIQAKCIIRKVVEECLFSIVDELNSLKVKHGDVNIDRHFTNLDEKGDSHFKGLSMSFSEIKRLLVQSAKLRQDWVKNHLLDINPDLAPKLKIGEDVYLKMYGENSLPIPLKYLDGSHTLWDIAQEMHKPILDIGKYFVPLIKQKIIGFQKLSDLSLLHNNHVSATPVDYLRKNIPLDLDNSSNHKSFTPNTDKKCKLIACIDDSQVVIHGLKKILLPAGYRVLPITEPMGGFGQMILYKPDLILLDINMPNADGYSVCQFLHRTSLFKHTPIIILTAREGELDRAHAKRVGAVAFINKPPQEQELLDLIGQCLSNTSETEDRENLSDKLKAELSHYSTPTIREENLKVL